MSTPETLSRDLESQRWVEALREGHPHRDRSGAKLHELLVRVAIHELRRQRGQQLPRRS